MGPQELERVLGLVVVLVWVEMEVGGVEVVMLMTFLG